MLLKSRNTNTLPTRVHCSVDQMATASRAKILDLIEPGIAARETGCLRELGFLPGEVVSVLRRGPGGREPIAVQIGETVFALRSIEAACIAVGCLLLTETT
jgi:ferrous iron transport protein A